MKLVEYPVAEVVPDPTAEVDAFREGWRRVRSLAKAQTQYAGYLVELDGDPDFHQYSQVYREMFATTWLAVQELIALAVKLSPEARQRVEAGVGPLFTDSGALSPWWRSLWLDDPRIAEASKVRRLNDRGKV